VGPSVLIVDDHADFRAFARALLQADGFEVVGEAHDGASALAMARVLKPALVLLDVQLPDLDGFAVCEELAGDDDAPVIVLTSSRDASTYRRRLGASRARGFIAKDELSGPGLASLAPALMSIPGVREPGELRGTPSSRTRRSAVTSPTVPTTAWG
jgi:DNA-binding NarL/FixJ family response regulator